MNYTLIDAINELKKIFDEETKDRNILNVEDAINYGNVKDVNNHLVKKDYDDFCEITSLLIIEFFNIMCNDMKNNNLIQDNQKRVLLHIIHSDKDDYIKSMYMEELKDLLVIISAIIEEYNFDCEFELEEYPYSYIEDLIKDSNVLNIYKKYHSNLELEMDKINEYIESNKLYEMISSLKVDDMFTFIYDFLILKQSIEDKYELVSIFMSKLWKIYSKNERLYMRIVYFLCGYYYITNKDKKGCDHESQTLLKAIEKCDDNLVNITRLDLLLNEFINFDLLKLYSYLDDFPMYMKKKLIKM